MESKRRKDQPILKKNEKLEPGAPIRGEIVGDRTLINVKALRAEYKLAESYANVRNLESRSPDPIETQTFADYMKLRRPALERIFEIKERPRPSYPEDEDYRNNRSRLHYPHGVMFVFVEASLYPAVSASIDRYVLDVGRDGYWATVFTVTGGTPAELRTFIAKRRPVGVLMVGALPVGWYEHDGAQFPCDLYFMDLGGTWSDPDGDGRFEKHTGGVDPEIWVGRLWTPTSGGNDAALINDYFTRNHQFRQGRLGHARSALAYVDDDWTGFGDCAFDQMFPPGAITTYTNPMTTDADLYMAEVNSMRAWVQLCAHSWTQGHALRVGSVNEYIQVPYFRDTNPPNAHFYNLFCCGPGKFTTADYLAGWYIFDKAGGGTNLGLAAIASAKSGSMLFFEDFYRPLGKGKILGDAFVDWWRARGPVHEGWEKSWFYGLVLLGDPTLTWWKGSVPEQQQPQPNDVFNHWPRKMELRWDPVTVPGVVYTVEIDAHGAVNAGSWAEENLQTFFMKHNVTGTTLDHSFVGAQRGRWRVRANVGGQSCAWSPWAYFRFTV